MRSFVVAAVTCGCLVAGGDLFAADDRALLPEDGYAGFKKAGTQRVFTGADLYGYIDGGAELFLEFGFEQLTQQKYTGGGSEFTVDLYRMSDTTAATGVYLMKCGKETRNAAFAERHTVNRHQLMFQRERYFVLISNRSGSEGLIRDLVRFGSSLASKMPASRPVLGLTMLPSAGQVAGSIRLVRGMYGLQSIFTLGDGDILLLGGTHTATAADYKDTALGAHTLVVAPYPDAAAARKAFEHLQRGLDTYLKVVEKGPTRLVFRDYQGEFGHIALAGTRLEIRLHLAKPPG